MPKYGNRWIEKLVPARGEAEVMARVKGSYGGKMQSRGYRKRGFRKNSTRNPEAEFTPGVYGNANWADGKVNLLWGNSTESGDTAHRLLSFNADTVAANEQQPQCFLRRINLELAFMAQVSHVVIGGNTVQEFDNNERKQIPAPGIASQTDDTETGAVIGGEQHASSLQGGASWMEGVPLTLFMIYETLQEAQTAIDFDGDGATAFFSASARRNKKIFWTKVVVPTAYRPVTVNLKHSFPGAGVRLSQGDREIYQVTLGFVSPAGLGSSAQTRAACFVGENRFWYFLDKP